MLGLGRFRKFNCDLAVDSLEVDMGSDVAHMLRRDNAALSRRVESLDAADELVVPSVRVAGATGSWTMRVRNPDTPLPNVVINDLQVTNCNITLADQWCARVRDACQSHMRR